MFYLLIFAAGWLETPPPIVISDLAEGAGGVAPLVLTNSSDRSVKVTQLHFEGDPAVFTMDTPQKLKIKPGDTVNVLVLAQIDEPGFYGGTVTFLAGDEPMSVPVSAWTVGHSPNAGILGALRDSDLDNVLASGGDLTGGIGGLIGSRGTPFAEGGIGSGSPYATQGLGSTTPHAETSISHTAFRTQNDQGQILSVGDPIILGALDKAAIDAVIAEDLDGLLACASGATGSGRVTVKFTIDTSGRVSATTLKATSLGNPTVEGCVLSRVGAMRFPSPHGGGIVIASYPFNFSSP